MIELNCNIDLWHYYITKLVPINLYLKYHPFYEKQVSDIFAGYDEDNVDKAITNKT